MEQMKATVRVPKVKAGDRVKLKWYLVKEYFVGYRNADGNCGLVDERNPDTQIVVNEDVLELHDVQYKDLKWSNTI